MCVCIHTGTCDFSGAARGRSTYTTKRMASVSYFACRCCSSKQWNPISLVMGGNTRSVSTSIVRTPKAVLLQVFPTRQSGIVYQVPDIRTLITAERTTDAIVRIQTSQTDPTPLSVCFYTRTCAVYVAASQKTPAVLPCVLLGHDQVWTRPTLLCGRYPFLKAGRKEIYRSTSYFVPPGMSCGHIYMHVPPRCRKQHPFAPRRDQRTVQRKTPTT